VILSAEFPPCKSHGGSLCSIPGLYLWWEEWCWYIFLSKYFDCWGTQWCSWLRHCTTSQKVFGSIPIGVAIALGSTQPLTEMSTRNISWGLRRLVLRADNLTTFMCLNLLEPSGPVQACKGIAHCQFHSISSPYPFDCHQWHAYDNSNGQCLFSVVFVWTLCGENVLTYETN
jgi:hypothetical protein